MRVPLEVGQIRDVAHGKAARSGAQRLMRIETIGMTGRCYVETLGGDSLPCMMAQALERCPVVDEQGRAVVEENAKPARPAERVIDDLRLRIAALEASILAADGPHKRDCSRPGLNVTAKCSCGLDALMGRTV